MRRSVFWKVALVLVGVQVVTGSLAVFLVATFAHARSVALAESSLRLRLDAVAEEIEQRADLRGGPDSLDAPLRADLADRFPDPITLLSYDGRIVGTLGPPRTTPLPERLDTLLAAEGIALRVEAQDETDTWGLAPLYDVDGLLAGGLLVQPLTASLARELAPTRAAYGRALATMGGVAVLLALALGALFALRLIRPLRRITQGVERIGMGDLAFRLSDEGADEIGRLAHTVNEMAVQVEASIDRLRQADALRRELVANVGHDLRTPLAALQGQTEEAHRLLSTGRTAEAGAALEAAQRQTQHLAHLVSDLFELSVLENAPNRLRREPVPLGELLRDAADVQRPLFRSAGVTLATDLPSGLPVLDADGARLLRLVGNLLDNARQHTPSGLAVQLAARTDDGAVIVTVADEGPGIASDMLPHLFERYARGTDARTRRGEGTGLGLAIASSIARAHGATLSAENRPEGGACFTLRLPT